jgi:hypothetical protein
MLLRLNSFHYSNKTTLIFFILEPTLYKKGGLIIKADDIVTTTYGIQNGCLITYHIDKHGKKHTLQFEIQGWWIIDFTAFFYLQK